MAMLDIDQETDSLADIIAAAYKVERSINQQTVHLSERQKDKQPETKASNDHKLKREWTRFKN